MDCSILWSGLHGKTITEEAALQMKWGALSGRLGAVPSSPFLLGIRGVALGAKESSKTRSKVAYDDTFCFYYPAGGIYLFAGSTHAFQLFSKQSPDVNGDGVGDVATIMPGHYVMTWKMDDAAGCPIFEISNPDGAKLIDCLRDVDHDGVAEAGPHKASAILFHTGPFGSPPNAAHKYSIGCQTTGKAPLVEMRDHAHVFPYVLVTAQTAVEIAQQLPSFVDTEPSPPEFV